MSPRRGAWAGALQIVRFNWPSYLFACAFAATCVGVMPFPGLPRLVACAALFPTVYWTVASLIVSHWVYDRSPLADWAWLPDWLSSPAGRSLIVQTGFDATHGRLGELLSVRQLDVVDLYGTPGVGGASVRRARAENFGDYVPGVAPPRPPGSYGAVIAIFSLHEIRRPLAREKYFDVLARALQSDGRIVVVEHLRDWSNFLAFGPGFLHFLPESEWRRCASAAGLRLERTESVTPFVRVFLWSKS